MLLPTHSCPFVNKSSLQRILSFKMLFYGRINILQMNDSGANETLQIRMSRENVCGPSQCNNSIITEMKVMATQRWKMRQCSSDVCNNDYTNSSSRTFSVSYWDAVHLSILSSWCCWCNWWCSHLLQWHWTELQPVVTLVDKGGILLLSDNLNVKYSSWVNRLNVN